MNTLMMFYVPCDTSIEACRLASHLIDQRLVAVANVIPGSSLYWWEHRVQDEPEFVVVAKTIKKLASGVEREILSVHKYEVPCIARIPIEVNKSYYEYVCESVGSTD